MGRRRDGNGELAKRLHQQGFSTAAGSKELAAAHAELESHKAKVDFLDDASKVCRKEVVEMNVVVGKQGL